MVVVSITAQRMPHGMGNDRLAVVTPACARTLPVAASGTSSNKVHLIGHSRGAQVMKMLTHPLGRRAQEERAASPGDVSPLFRGQALGALW